MMLSRGAVKKIGKAVDDLFATMKARFLGPRAAGLTDKNIVIRVNPALTLPGLYEAAAVREGGYPSQATLHGAMEIAEGYLDAQQARAKALVIHQVEAFIADAQNKGFEADIKAVLGGQLSEIYQKVGNDVKSIVQNETQSVKAIGVLEGIVKINAQAGIDDPTVYFIIVRDGHACDECIRLHLMPDGVTPRTWKLSQVGSAYHKKGENFPKLRGLHPNCRCSMATLLPGWGFDGAGMTRYISPTHDEYEVQHSGLDKSEHMEYNHHVCDGDHCSFEDIHKADEEAGPKLAAAVKKAPRKTKAQKDAEMDAQVSASLARMAPKPPVEPKKPQLLAVHNMSEGNLAHAHEMGGMAAPSLAVVHQDHPLTDFGEITMLGDHNMVDPKVTPVFDADIYSPRNPRAKNAINDKKMDKLLSWLKPHANHVGAYTHSLKDELEQYGVDSAMGHWTYGPALQAAYLHEKGHPVPAVMQEKKLRYQFATKPALQQLVAENPKVYGGGIDFRDPLHLAIEAKTKEAIDQHLDSRNLDPEMKEKVRQSAYKAVFKDVNVNDQLTHQMPFNTAVSIWNDARSANESSSEKDTHATADAVRKKFSDLSPEEKSDYDRWAREKLSGVIGDRYIPKRVHTANGPVTRRIPYNLDNVLKEMTKVIRQGESFNYGIGTARAAGARQFKTLDQMRDSSHKLVSAEDMEKVKAHNQQKFDELAAKIDQYGQGGFGHDGLLEAIGNSYKRGKYLARELQEVGYSGVPSDVVQHAYQFSQDLKDSPTGYFEAKPQRIVRLNEFKGAVVPHDASAETLERLKQNGIEHTETYQRDDVNSRREALKRLSQKLGLAF